MSNALKVLDMNDPKFEDKLVQAFRDIGAVQIINSGISSELIDRAYAEWHPDKGGFFGLSDEEKMAFLYSKLSPACDDPEVGWYPYQSEKGSTHDKKNSGSANLNEYYHIKAGIDGSYPTTGDFAATRELAARNYELVKRVLDIMEANGPSAKDAPHFGNLAQSISAEKWSTFRILHYPPVDWDGENDDEMQLIKVHKDKGCLTTVISPSEGGLSVQDREGTYHRVPHTPGAIVVQVGEGLELMSNGYYYAGRHTVMGRPSGLARRRLSMARFWHFTPETRLSDDLTNGDMMAKYWAKKGLEVTREKKRKAGKAA